MRSVKLPEGVAKISDRAFFFCQAMDSINLPESLQIIGGNAFYGCLSLTRLYIPANVISIDCLTFGWTSLREINVASGNSHYASRDGVLYNGSMTTLIFYPPNRPGQEFTLPDTVTEIGFYAIDRPVNLKKLILNSSLREFSVGRITGSIADISAKNNPYFCDIDGVLFSADGSKLIAYPSGRNGTSYTVPDGTSSIGTYAFADAGWLQVLDLPGQPGELLPGLHSLVQQPEHGEIQGNRIYRRGFYKAVRAIKKPGGQRPCNKRAGTYDRPAVF